MPNPHFRVSHISRGVGQNAVASAAYRAAETLYDYRSPLDAAAYQSGTTLTDEGRGQVFSFAQKGGVLHTEILLPYDAPEWAGDREKLWNAVERAEDTSTRRSTARLAVDFVGSLPRELSHDEHRILVNRFVRDQFTRKGLAVDVAFHEVKARDGGKNPHVHMMVTTRRLDCEGFGEKARWMDGYEALARWRTSWEHHSNRLLEMAGRDERLSLKCYREQGIDKIGHEWMPREDYELEQRGTATMIGDVNRKIDAENALREERRRQKQDENSGDGRTAWYETFSRDFGGATDAKRDAVHRFRQKEGATMSDTRTTADDALLNTAVKATQVEQAAAARAAVQAGQVLVRAGVRDQGAVSEQNLGNLQRPLTPRQDRSRPTERYRGRNQENNDTPRHGPGTPPRGAQRSTSPPRRSPAEQRARASVAVSVQRENATAAQQVNDIIPQQPTATMQRGAREITPQQPEQSPQPAAPGAPNGYDNIFERYAGKADDTGIEREKDKQHEHGMER